MTKKIKIIGIFLLAFCLFSVCTDRTTEAAPTPDEIIKRLQNELDALFDKAQKKFDRLEIRIGKLENRFDKGKLSIKKFNRKLNKVHKRATNIHDKYYEKIAMAAWKWKKKLLDTGASQSMIDDADFLRNELYKAIDDANNKVLSQCE